MSNYQEGDNVFFRHPEHSWVCGVVESIGKGGIICHVKDEIRKEVTQNENITLKNLEDVEPLHRDALNDTPNDLLNLTVLHEATLLGCLYMRYMSDIVYTNIGAIVVALNPFSYSIPHYQEVEMKKYLNAGRNLSSTVLPSNLVPHSWAQAHITYFEMVDTMSNQCIIVSGESGAGKTEATKIVLKYLGIISSLSGSGEEQKAALNVGEKLVACSPILECFGNAKTIRNDNSSRFGKFMKVKFNSKNLVVGAETIKYLLEKSRIVSAAKGERLYHSFYLLVRVKNSITRNLHLDNEKEYISLSSGETLNNSEYNTEDDFNNVCKSMKEVGMSESEITSVWRVTAAVMTLLNVKFIPEEDSCSIDPNTLHFLKKAVHLLDINEEGLIHEFLTSTRVLPGNQIALNPNDVISAVDIRDALCKHLYDGIFGWLVQSCNDLCNVENDSNWIGLLDIFGFEDFKLNSFEQLCINLTNENLQYHYNLHIFKRDMDECKKEGVDVTDVKFPDNTGCLKMLTAQGGIFPLLDESCWLGGGTDNGFLEKVVNTHENNLFFKKDRVSSETFCVKHYAADVTYNVKGWIEKNRDTLKDPIKVLIRNSGDKVIASCLPAPIPISEKKKGGKNFTVSGFFCNQLNSLMDLINSTNPHWIRCIKPHPIKKPRMFHGKQTMNQLESSGVLGTVKIRKAGYPVRIPINNFYQKYKICSSLNEIKEKEFILDILKKANINVPSQAQIGSTKVFLKAEALNILESFRNQCLIKTSLTLQKISRGYLGRQRAFNIFYLLHKAEIFKKKWENIMKNFYLKEIELRESYECEEEESFILIMQLEEEKRVLQNSIEFAERERKWAEEKERKRIEEEERKRIEEAKKLEELRIKAAICIQRHVRGELLRIKLYRQLLEEQRAAFEQERELACEEERIEIYKLDLERISNEKSWIQWLNSVDHLKRKKQQDEQRLLEKTLQRRRILIRELVRKEDQYRLKIEVEESDAYITLIARFKTLASHIIKSEEERKKRVEQIKAKRIEISHLQPPGVRAREERSLASDIKIKKSLTEYALSRARYYDEKIELERVLPVKNQTLSNKKIKEGSKIFNKVQKSWLRQQEWKISEDENSPISYGSKSSIIPNYENNYNNNDDRFNGPHRTIEASLQSISPILHFPLTTPPTSKSSVNIDTRESAGMIDSTSLSYDTQIKKSKGSIDWDSIFRS